MAKDKTSPTNGANFEQLGAQLAIASDNGAERVEQRARVAFDQGLASTRNFEAALAQVMYQGYLLGRAHKPQRKSRAKREATPAFTPPQTQAGA